MTDEPEYKTFPFEECSNALADIRRQHENGDETLIWTGPDRLHHSVAATCPPPSELLSPEGLEYDEERGRDFWDVYTMVAFHLGFHNGAVTEARHTKSWRSGAEFWEKQAKRAEEEGEKVFGLRFLAPHVNAGEVIGPLPPDIIPSITQGSEGLSELVTARISSWTPVENQHKEQ